MFLLRAYGPLRAGGKKVIVDVNRSTAPRVHNFVHDTDLVECPAVVKSARFRPYTSPTHDACSDTNTSTDKNVLLLFHLIDYYRR